ncbi:hypothetical protein [Arthrobacter burdickii]|uniref:Uncharacterized protein n=1 Tax=Arthrobacter burdickii TaxID=3035920 RepID=A0ABT8K225_9MICC|nr:hypothetical protein [Arthrobacter burdickii]MDN4611466.1 hypothetical protein [Arthrobacter burdickii]
MGWKAALVIALLWAAFAVWVWTTNGALIFVIGAIVLAAGFAVTAVNRKRAVEPR